MNRAPVRRRIAGLVCNNVVCGGSPQPHVTARYTARCIHASSRLHRPKSQKDLFTPSPFARSDRINVSEKFAIRRELKEGNDPYGFRRYILVPRTDDFEDDQPKQILASLNAVKNILFGAQLNLPSTSGGSDEDYISKYLAACGPLLDIAKQDASVNGQQVQALATLRGLCTWVSECIDNDGEGSEMLTGLIHGGQTPTASAQNKKNTELPPGKLANQKIKDVSANLVPMKKKSRMQMLDAIRAIATGIPRPGHSVVGAGTYRDGEIGWVALAREYTELATIAEPGKVDVSCVGRRGLEEVALYKSRDGEVTKIEHLAHTQPEYLRDAGGAMARLHFL